MGEVVTLILSQLSTNAQESTYTFKAGEKWKPFLSQATRKGSIKSPSVGFFAWSLLLLGWCVSLRRGLTHEALQKLDRQSRSFQTLTAYCLGGLLGLPTQAKGPCLHLYTYTLVKAGDPDHAWWGFRISISAGLNVVSNQRSSFSWYLGQRIPP